MSKFQESGKDNRQNYIKISCTIQYVEKQRL